MSQEIRKDRHTKFGPSGGVPAEDSTKKPFDRSISRQKDTKIVRKGDWSLNNPNDDVLSLEDQKEDEQAYQEIDQENAANHIPVEGSEDEAQESKDDEPKEQKKPADSDFPKL